MLTAVRWWVEEHRRARRRRREGLTEYRLYVTVPGLPAPPPADELDPHADEAWEPLADHLAKTHPELGPILAWNVAGGEVVGEVVLATDTVDEAQAARVGRQVVAAALAEVGMHDLAPTTVSFELVTGD